MITTEDIKFYLSCAFFILVVYPVKRVIIPVLTILRDQAYFFLSLLIGFVLIYLYDYDIDKIIRDFMTKMSIENSAFLQWLVTPLFFDSVFLAPLVICVFIAAGCSFVKLVSGWVRILKVAAGIVADGILAILYVYYTITGNQELSTVCSTNKDERRTKIVVYSLVCLLLAGVIAFVLLTMKTELQTVLTSTNVMLNATFPNETSNITRVTLDFIPDLPYQNITEFVP